MADMNTSGAATAVSRNVNMVSEGGTDRIKIGLIGCGGRGTGAVDNCMSADPTVTVVAVADLFENKAKKAAQGFKNKFKDRCQIKDDQVFWGFDAYKKLVACDLKIVLMATAPVFRPYHLRAAIDALPPGADLETLAGQEFGGEFVVDWTTKLDPDIEDPVTHLAYGWATQVVLLDDEGRLARVIAAQDVGRAMNPTLLEGQVEGGVHMGLGLALTEAFVAEGGVPLTTTLKSQGIIPASGMPPVEVIVVEEHQPEGPYGAKGAGEAVLVPTPAAVAGALHAFDGRWRTALPMRDSAAARAALPRVDHLPAAGDARPAG
jgi:hypothetical protein